MNLKNAVKKLNVVALPIGNLNEISQWAKLTLSQANLVICENTINAKTFYQLNQWNTSKISFISHHKFNESSRINYLLEKIKAADVSVLISDAGYPGICDPGSRLINACWQNNIPVQVINGPCALIQCLVSSGWSDYPFVFFGFGSHVQEQIIVQLKQYQWFNGVIAFYVSVHALEKTIAAIETVFGLECQVCIGRELSKKYETILIGNLNTIKNHIIQKGEFVFLVNNTSEKTSIQTIDSQQSAMINDLVNMGIKLKNACKFVGKYTQTSHNELYNLMFKKVKQ